MNTAANVITTASNTLGADNAEVLTAQDALTAFSNDLDGVKAGKTRLHALYEDNETLGTAIDQLYAKLQEQAADPMKILLSVHRSVRRCSWIPAGRSVR